MTIPNFWVLSPEQQAKCLLLGIVVRQSSDKDGWVVQELTSDIGRLLVREEANAVGALGKTWVQRFKSVDEAITCASKVLAGELKEYSWWPK